MPSFSARLPELAVAVERALEGWLPAPSIAPTDLHQAMRYAVLGNGKRMRPLLVYATGATLGIPREALDGPACAVELVHAYSLVHDDLPAMDDDDLRRGQPTCHKAFGEATAILAGDALQALAFHVLAHDGAMLASAGHRVQMIDTLAVASGSRGMAGGQALDLAAVGRTLTLAELENMHIHKTGALIRASVVLAAMSSPEVDAGVVAQLDHYAKRIGLAFQVQDDILDIEGDPESAGKRLRKDEERGKATFVSLLGLEGAQAKARDLVAAACDSLSPYGSAAGNLRLAAQFVLVRGR